MGSLSEEPGALAEAAPDSPETASSRPFRSGQSWSHLVDSLWLRASDGSLTDAPSTETERPQGRSTASSKSSTVTPQTAPRETQSKCSCNGKE